MEKQYHILWYTKKLLGMIGWWKYEEICGIQLVTTIKRPIMHNDDGQKYSKQNKGMRIQF